MALATDWSKLSTLVVVRTVGKEARAPSSGQHRLQHYVDRRLWPSANGPRQCDDPRGRNVRSPGFSFTLTYGLCIGAQQFTCGFLFTWIVIFGHSYFLRNVRIRYMWVAALKRAHYSTSGAEKGWFFSKGVEGCAAGHWVNGNSQLLPTSKEFSNFKDLLGLLCFFGLERIEPINVLLSMF